MKLRDVVDGLKRFRPTYERDERLGVDEVPDKTLHSLRRLRQAQLNDVEKRRLREDIDRFNKAREVSGFYGESPLRGDSGYFSGRKKVLFNGKRRGGV